MAKQDTDADAPGLPEGAGDKAGETGAAKAAAPPAKTAQGTAQGAQDSGQSAIELLKADHRAVEALFAAFESADEGRKAEIVEQVCQALTIHTRVEEEIFYPACREAASEEDKLDEAQVEHDSAKVLIADLSQGRDDPYRDAKFKVLAEQIRHHVKEEEAPGVGVFAKAKAAGIDTPDLARRVAARMQALKSQGERLSASPVVSIQGGGAFKTRNRQESTMPRNGPDRDDRGRFTSDDDDRGYRSRSRYDDDDERGYSSRSRGGGRGWYGDREGHAEAAERGWDERRGEGRSFARDDDDRGYGRSGSQYRDRDAEGRFTSEDDRGYRSRGGYDRDDRGGRSYAAQDRDRDSRGRFMSDDDDDRGYRSRGRYDRDDDDRRTYASRDGGRGHGGWYGDPQGHAEASRRGWEERDGGSRSRARDDDDDRRRYSSRGRDDDRGHGGWFGDSEGHSEAARRGWEGRR